MDDEGNMKEEGQITEETDTFQKKQTTYATENTLLLNKNTLGYHDTVDTPQDETIDLTPIHSNEDLYKIIAENLLEGIIILDFKGKILYANPAMTKLLGYTTITDLLGTNILEYIDEKFHSRLVRDQLLVRIGKGGFLDTYQAKTKNNRRIWIEGLGYKINYKGQYANVVFFRDISDRRKTWDQLVQLEKKYRAIAEMSADGIITLDPIGKITYANPAFLKMINTTQDNIINSVFRMFLHEDSIYHFQQLLLDSRKTNEEINNIELDLDQKEKGTIPIEISITPILEKNEFTGYICMVHDITERKKIEAEMHRSEQLKTEFMNIAAHELKSPVTPIKGYLDLIISDDESNEKIKKWAQVSLRNAERLLLLVNDILDVSRLDNDTMKFEMKRIDTTEMLKEIAEDFQPAIEDKDLTFNVTIPDNLPKMFGDYHRLHQVFKNIFVNALKFTEKGSISFSAELKGALLVIAIADTGIGIKQDDLKKIFKKFYQAYTGDNRKHEGTGLGLFICKEIVKKHNGDIAVKSTPNKGTTFFISLPVLQHELTLGARQS